MSLHPPGPVYPTGVPFHTGDGYDDVQVAAAESIRPHLRDLQRLALRTLLNRSRCSGITSRELAESIDGHLKRLYTWAPRLTELAKAGVIVDSGMRRRHRTTTQRLKVWVLADKPSYDAPDVTATRRLVPWYRARIRELEAANAKLEGELKKARARGQRSLWPSEGP